MIESKPKSLATNINKTNINNETEFRLCSPHMHAFEQVLPYQENSSSIAKFFEDFQALGLNDENQIPPSSLPGLNEMAQSAPENEIAMLRAELEATRSKLAQYEGVTQPQRFAQACASPEYHGSDGFQWSDTTSSDLYPVSNTLSVEAPSSVPPLRLPSTPPSFQPATQNAPVSQNTAFNLKSDTRNFSLPMAGTIGDPRRITRRICSESVTTRPRDPWKAEADWSPPGPAASFDPVNRQAASSNLGVDPSTSPAQSRYGGADNHDWRRLLDRSMSCNWNSILEKVICQTDQQSSLFLQQKLKLAAPAQKHEIVDCIIGSASSLMTNRFGNFLVQRCFEYGTEEQVEAISNAMKGKVVSLSMDPFGCHVVQKAFDCVDEEIKAEMVKELLCRIPETVSHRFACHVWQKLLETRWTGAAPVVMKYVNDALRGGWTGVALGETGSLVVQNIFENCLDEDKRPCIDEILKNVDTIARGQWGNWVIQHVIEHGQQHDRLRALDIVLNHSAKYSTDQYASKVIEKMLKCCGTEIFHTYIAKLVEQEPGRPRVALIDICSDIYGNYLIQYVLQNAPHPIREQISFHVRKHMVSLRGSRYGQRVAFQVERMKTMQKSANWQGHWE